MLYKSRSLLADRGNCSQHPLLHPLDGADQMLVPTLLLPILKHLLDESLNKFPDLSLAIPLTAHHRVLVRFQNQLLLPEILNLYLECLSLRIPLILHFLHLPLQFLNTASRYLQLMDYFPQLVVLLPYTLKLGLILLHYFSDLLVFVRKHNQLVLLHLLNFVLEHLLHLYFLNFPHLDLLNLPGQFLLLLLQFLPKVFLLLVNKLHFLINFLVILIILNVETVSQFLDLSQFVLLQIPHLSLILVQLPSQLEHMLVFLPVLLQQLAVRFLHRFQLKSYLLYLNSQFVDTLAHGVVVFPLDKDGLF